MSDPGRRSLRPLDGATVAVLMALILAPMIAMWIAAGAEGSAGESEKRTLASAPSRPRTWAEAARWPDAADAYLRDRFGFRQTLIRWHSRLLYSVFRTSSSPKVVIGDADWLYYIGGSEDGRPIADYRGSEPIPGAQLEWLRLMIEDQHEWLRERGIRYLLVIVPSKEEVHPEHLPSAVTRVGSQSSREQLLDHLAGRGLPILDLTPVLREAARRDQVFLKTDTHWNSYGCVAAGRAILGALGLPSEQDEAFGVKQVRVNGGDLALLMNLAEYLSETHGLRVPRTPRRGRWRRIGEGDMADIVGGVDDPSRPRAVVYRDSFTDGLVSHLTEQFSEIHFIWARFGAKVNRAVEYKPDIVLQIMADRVFRTRLHYSPEIQQERLRRRLDAGSELVWRREAWTEELPPPRDARGHLPVVEVDLTARRRTALELTWEKRGESGCPVQPGRSRIFLPVFDPAAAPPFRLHVRGRMDDVEIHAIELRETVR